MRITDQIIDNTVLSDAQANLTELNQLNAEASSGQRILKPSDDPAGAVQELSLQTVLNNLAQYKTNSNSANASLTGTLSVLTQVQTLIGNAKTQALAAANDVNSPTSDAAAADVVASLQQQLLALANTQQNGIYIFGGSKTSTPPFNADGTYTGDTNTISTAISPGQNVATNVNGQTAFKTGVDLFQFLNNLHTALVNNDSAGISDAITTADTALNQNLEVQGSVGALSQQVQSNLTQLSSTTLTYQTLQSQNSDADITQVVSQLQETQNAYQASISAGGQLLQTSLMNYWNPTGAVG